MADKLIKGKKKLKNSRGLYFFCLRFLTPISRVVLRIRYEGKENIPKDGGYIVCCNHRSTIDCFLLAVPFKRQIRYMAKSELFENHGRFIAWLMHKVGAFPVQRGKADASSVREAVHVIRDGDVLGIFPQGHCVQNNAPFQAKAGVALIAAKTDAPILPACIYCSDGRLFKPFRRITVRYGPLITHEELQLQEDSLTTVRAAAGLVSTKINGLLEAGY